MSNKAQANLYLARWVYQDAEWHSLPSGIAFSNKYGDFDVDYSEDRDDIRLKLRQDHNWKIRQLPDGQWIAEKRGEWHKKPLLEDLLVLVVELVVEGR